MKLLTSVFKFALTTCIWLAKTSWSLIIRLLSAIESDERRETDKVGEFGMYHDLRTGEVHPTKRQGGVYIEDE